MIVAKFTCQSITKDSSGGETVKLTAVTGDSDENKSWSEYTPYGSLEMLISNKAAHGKFVPGEDYILRFEAAQ